jgi:hypothetical protein
MLRDCKSILERLRSPKKKTEIEPGMSPEEISDIISDKLMDKVRASFAETKEKLEKRNNMKDEQLFGTATSVGFVLGDGLGTSSTTYAVFDPWHTPVLVDTIKREDSIELVYKRISRMTLSTWPAQTEVQVYKIIYSCVDGKWNESDKIFGEIFPAQEETYSFDGQPV